MIAMPANLSRQISLATEDVEQAADLGENFQVRLMRTIVLLSWWIIDAAHGESDVVTPVCLFALSLPWV
jgi:hypothetical protein